MAFDLTAAPMPALLLLLGGLIALVIAIVGRNPRTKIDNIAVALGFVVGAVMVIEAILLLTSGSGAAGSTVLITGLLGFGLFMRVFRKVKIALIIALIAALFTGIFLYLLEQSIHTGYLTPLVIVIISIIVLAIVYGLLSIITLFANIAGAVMSWRPVLFILGILALIESALLFSNSSLSALLGW
jgi:hypothetical protein